MPAVRSSRSASPAKWRSDPGGRTHDGRKGRKQHVGQGLPIQSGSAYLSNTKKTLGRQLKPTRLLIVEKSHVTLRNPGDHRVGGGTPVLSDFDPVPCSIHIV